MVWDPARALEAAGCCEGIGPWGRKREEWTGELGGKKQMDTQSTTSRYGQRDLL